MIFSDEEALALAVGLMAARGLGLAQSMPAVASARAKLERVFPAKLKSRLRAVDESVALELTRPAARHRSAGAGPAVQRHAGAAPRAHGLSIAQRASRPSASSIPMASCIAAGRWYIVGWCHLRRGLRSFRLDRVVSASSSP